MKTFILIAWRNMWRSPRRSGLVIAAIMVGLWGLLFSLGFTNGMGLQMINNQLDNHMGHLQVHSKDYKAVIEGFDFFKYQLPYYIASPEEVEKAVDGAEHVKAWAPRVITTGLATNAQNARGVAIIGIDPDREKNITLISRSVKEGQYISPDTDNEILIGDDLADKLNVELGSKVVLMAQDLEKHKAMGAFRIVGIYDTAISMHDEAYVYVSSKSIQQMLGLGDKIHEVVAVVDNPRENLEVAKQSVMSRLDTSKYTVYTWKEIWPLLVRLLGMFDVFTYIFFILIFIAMAFGIANAVLMAVFERIREFGVMKALGTKPSQIFLVVALESVCLGMVGVALGIGAGWATVLYFGKNGMDLSMFSAVLQQMGLGSVIYTKMKMGYLVWGSVMALMTALLSALWPAGKAARLNPVEAIRHV